MESLFERDMVAINWERVKRKSAIGAEEERTSKDKSNQVLIQDKRIPFPSPKLENMFGFRFNQKEKTIELLKANRSGILNAPTRYGKSVIMTNIINAHIIIAVKNKTIVVNNSIQNGENDVI